MTDTSSDISVRCLNASEQLKNSDRWKVAKDTFVQIFNQNPTFYVNVPGR